MSDVQRFWCHEASNIFCVRASDFDRVTAENAALQKRLNAADQQIDELTAKPDAPTELTFKYRHPTTGETLSVTLEKSEVAEGMEDSLYEKLAGQLCSCEPIGETNVVDCNCSEYTDDFELDLKASPDDWLMNPCKQGHRDVGAASGVAHCYTCNEKIEAATTQEAFERWNASHPVPQG